MMKKLLFVVLFLCLCGYSRVLFAADPYRLLIFGDSLSAGYGVGEQKSFASLLQIELHEKGYKNVKVINQSKSGETTSGALLRLNSVLNKVKPNGVLLELGINDVFQGNSILFIEKNLSRIIEICQQRGIFVLLAGMKAPPYAGIIYQRKFDQMYENLASKYNLILYPFFMKGLIKLENGMPISKYTLSDKVHPNIQGIGLIVQNIMPYVEKFLKESE